MGNWDAETAEWYADHYGEYDTNRLGIASLDLEADFTILDIGCGTGCALRHAAAHVTRGQLIGVDPVPRMIEIACERTATHPAAGRIEYHKGTAEQLPAHDASIDVVLAFDSYDHWQDHARGLREVHRVLATQGTFAIVKDGGLPDGEAAREAFLKELHHAGFQVIQTITLEEGEVLATRWLCKKNI